MKQMNVRQGDTIAVWFSCGIASAAALITTVEKYHNYAHIRVLNNPIAEEDEDNRRFLDDVATLCNVTIESVASSNYPSQSCVEVWEKRRFMSSPNGAICTHELKKRARYEWECNNHADWHVFGFTLEEENRHKRFVAGERPNVIPVLIDAKMTRQDCAYLLAGKGIRPPRVYSLGYANANCLGCPKATSPTYWNLLRKTHPEVFRQRAEQSRDIGAKLVRVKNERIFLDELSPDAKGRPIKEINFECGVLCEEHHQAAE